MRQDIRNRGPESRSHLLKIIHSQRQRCEAGLVSSGDEEVGSEQRGRAAAGATSKSLRKQRREEDPVNRAATASSQAG